ncbi:MAG: ATP-binding cassette domain-containing protein, partial [Nitrospinota bacterium]|nr:ATP-binding cassette domain-containing protein [Nitrospinota bacterium]
MIQLYNVYKSYNNTPALVDVSFIIKKGAFVFVTGPSGAGKSTLLKLMYRWESYDKGQVLINGINVGKLKFNKLWQLRRHIGVVFQD